MIQLPVRSGKMKTASVSGMLSNNFSLLTDSQGQVLLAPAYDLLNTRIALKDDPEESALTINGKKRKIQRRDFDALAKSLELNDRQIANSYLKFERNFQDVLSFINRSFLPQTVQQEYISVLIEGYHKLDIQAVQD
ncbi:MAG: HipA domain-containing protein [Chitinophagaceae bacterium]